MSDRSLAWKLRAACRDTDPDQWFPSGVGSRNPTYSTAAMEADQAQRCYELECPVMQECRDYAVENNIQYGVWGGMAASSAAFKRLRSQWVRAQRAS